MNILKALQVLRSDLSVLGIPSSARFSEDWVTARARQLALKCFGIHNVRYEQMEAIISVCARRHDTVVVLPTGGGKSLVMWLTSMILSETMSRPSLIIVPMISLMKNHVRLVCNFSTSMFFLTFLCMKVTNLLNTGCRVGAINANVTSKERVTVVQNLESGTLHAVMITPEMFRVWRRSSQDAYACALVDESHLVSEGWRSAMEGLRALGSDCRSTMSAMPIVALTATPGRHHIDLMCKYLGMQQYFSVHRSSHRPNITYKVHLQQLCQSALLIIFY